MKNFKILVVLCVLNTILFLGCMGKHSQEFNLLDQNRYRTYIDTFNQNDNELYKQYISNDSAWNFLKENIPFVDLPDKGIEETYYFRWWTFRKHIKKTTDGFVITEFLPAVGWAGRHNTINCPAAHQINEGKWLRNPIYVDNYINFWLRHSQDGIRSYSFWAAHTTLELHKVHPDIEGLKKQFPLLVDNYKAWEESRRDPEDLLFWQIDDRDGMEVSVGGRILREGDYPQKVGAIRPTINSYMYGDARALAEIASTIGDNATAELFSKKADTLKKEIQNRLWNKELGFFSSLPRAYDDSTKTFPVRELLGYVPWYFNLPDDSDVYSDAWKQVLDTTGFSAPVGLTSCERRHPYFEISYKGHECQWNGPSWPFATTQTLKGLSNLLANYKHNGGLDKSDYYNLLKQYANSHYIINEDGSRQNWIDENLNPFTGDWISRTRLKTWANGTWSKEKGGIERGKDYNHSGFCDLVISDLLGLKARNDNTIEIKPLVPEDWDWFALDRVRYHDKNISVIWDRTGEKYKKGKGLMIFVDGNLKSTSSQIKPMEIKL
ncbi:MAG: hypothetical protein KAJ23_13795 [Maribacter sp.]|nr:hypothetical protein [Maribacter sp.]